MQRNLKATLNLYFEDLNVDKKDENYFLKLAEWNLDLNLRPFEAIDIEQNHKVVKFKCRILYYLFNIVLKHLAIQALMRKNNSPMSINCIKLILKIPMQVCLSSDYFRLNC